MGMALQAVSDLGKLLRHNPIILSVGVAAMLLYSVLNFVLGLIPLIGNLLALLLYPAFIAGLLGIIYAGRDGTASAGDFLSEITESYLPMLGAYALAMLPVIFFSVLFAVAAIFVFPSGSTQPTAATGAATGATSGLASAGPALVVFLVVWLVFGLGYLFLQFFNVAIVAGEGVIDSFQTSIQMALTAPLSTLGFTLIKFTMGGVILGIPWAIMFFALFGGSMAGDAGAAGLGGAFAGGVTLVALLGYVLVAVPLWRVVTSTYHVAYFNRRQAHL